MRALSFVIAFAALSAFPALAQDAPIPITVGPAQVSPDDWNTTEVTVVGKFPGPALWRVKRGESEVYIVGGVPVMLRHFDWDRGRIGRILDKANVLLVGPKARGGPIALAEWTMVGHSGDMYAQLPPAMATRFKALATANGIDPKTYVHDTPVVAVMKLRTTVYDKHGLSTTDPEKMLVFMARDRKTPMKPIASYAASDLISKVGAMPKDARVQCVNDTLNEIDFALVHAEAATHAWATADLVNAKANSPNSATLACLEGASSTRGLLDNGTNDAIKAVNFALSQPGKSVITFPLAILLRPNGVLDQLRAEGADVSVPDIK